MTRNLLDIALCILPGLLFSIEAGNWMLLVTWPYNFGYKGPHHITKIYQRNRNDLGEMK